LWSESQNNETTQPSATTITAQRRIKKWRDVH
jgi:hypothetical protein